MAGSPNRGVIPNVNSIGSHVPTNQQLGFSPEGPGALRTIVQDPMGLILAAAADKAARDATNRMYPGVVAVDNAADAFRHGAGSRLLSGMIGEKRAKNWGDAHEVEGVEPSYAIEALGLASKNNDGQRKMDLYNNRVGRGLRSGRAEDVKAAIEAGLFRTRRFGE